MLKVKTMIFLLKLAIFGLYCILLCCYFSGKTICATNVSDLGILLEIVQMSPYATTVDFLGENFLV